MTLLESDRIDARLRYAEQNIIILETRTKALEDRVARLEEFRTFILALTLSSLFFGGLALIYAVEAAA